MLIERAMKGGDVFMRIRVRYGLRLTVLMTLFAVVFGLVGCRNGNREPTAMLSEALDAEMTLDADGITYCVTVHLGEVQEGGVRDAEVIFLSPDSLSGMAVRENADGVTVTQNGITTVGGERTRALLLAASLLCPAETVRASAESEGGRVYTVCRLSDGRALYFDGDTGVLSRIESDGCRATVMWIERR